MSSQQQSLRRREQGGSLLRIIGIVGGGLYIIMNAALIATFHFTQDLRIGPLQPAQLSIFLQRSVASLQQRARLRGSNDTIVTYLNVKIESSKPDSNHHNEKSRRILSAYFETIDQDQWKIKPLPRRSSTAADLKQKVYANVNSCSKLPEQLPTDEPPTDEDPFLPWLHDVFPTADGKYIQFIAQNRRRCQSGKEFSELKKYLQPNIALFQHVPVKRIEYDDGTNRGDGRAASSVTRYRLASHEDADIDGMETRFICRFSSGEETLSVFNFNYDWHSKRKGYKYTFTEEGFDVHMIWSSQLHFRCPVPANLIEIVKAGSSVVNDYATLFVDLVPIRTAPRYGYPNQFLPPKYGKANTFIADDEWGKEHVLPLIEDSGRIENIPICKPSLMQYPIEPKPDRSSEKEIAVSASSPYGESTNDPEKKFELISCVWTSSSFHTRGDAKHVTDNARRLQEWAEFHLMTGFDHIVLYDNSEAQGEGSETLESITDLFPGQVTRINWPSKVCNNRPSGGDNKGERSSQYAAESSCRLRFGFHANWIGNFDLDEYMIPMISHDNLPSMKEVIKIAYSKGINILNFKSMRAWPRRELLSDPGNPEVSFNETFLRTYNCDQELPKLEDGKYMRHNTVPAEKQIYRSDYVLLHFVHYSTVTVRSIMSQKETEAAGLKWTERYQEKAVAFLDEVNEARMLHSKSVVAGADTHRWETQCKNKRYSPALFNHLSKKNARGMETPCKLGTPFPPNKDPGNGNDPVLTDSEGFTCNCFVNEKIENVLVPKLMERMRARLDAKGVLNVGV